jgi:alkanesulfonate monooxygenase SsuD/methylene tetrahydromethanopterin reductase-like flavin-dependent oxidoreductase (luciferase family)
MRLQIPFSVLDSSNVRLGETPREALQQTVDLARHVEALGFKRFWLTECKQASKIDPSIAW